MKISCNIIEDLIPLYHDGVCSEDSKKIIEDHLKECEICNNYLKALSGENFQKKINIDNEEVKVNTLKLLKKRLFRKNIRFAIFSIVSIVIMYSFIFKLELPIKYKEGLVLSQEIEENNIKLSFLGDNFYKNYFLIKTTEINGEEKNILMIYYTDSIWTKLSSKQLFKTNNTVRLASGGENFWGAGNFDNINVDKDIDRIYYTIGNYEKLLNDKEMDIILEESTLIWKK